MSPGGYCPWLETTDSDKERCALRSVLWHWSHGFEKTGGWCQGALHSAVPAQGHSCSPTQGWSRWPAPHHKHQSGGNGGHDQPRSRSCSTQITVMFPTRCCLLKRSLERSLGKLVGKIDIKKSCPPVQPAYILCSLSTHAFLLSAQ